jgi:hypothetical protein
VIDETERQRYERRVRWLAGLGHRGSTTENEREAAEYLQAELSTAGIEAALIPFTGHPTLAWLLLLPVAVAALGAALTWVTPWAGLLLGPAALATLILEQGTRADLLCRLLPQGASQNVEARIPAEGVPVRRIVVLGHYDTQRTGRIFNPRLARIMEPLMARSPGPLKSPIFMPQLAMVLQSVAALWALLSPGSSAASVILGFTLTVHVVTAALLIQWGVSPYGPGASDNASGAAAVLALGERWRASESRPEGVELVLLCTGCEEANLRGATEWIKARGDELRHVPTLFINIDTLGYGTPRFTGCEHSITGWPAFYPPAVLEVCHEAAEQQGLVDAGPHTLPLPTDGLPLLARRLPGATVISFERHGLIPHYHQQGDTADNMDFDVAWRAVELGWGILEGLARR